MKKFLFTYGLIITTFYFTGLCWALTYSEADSGDLNQYAIKQLTFGQGTNIITGSIAGGFGSDLDSFKFTLPAGLTLTSAVITFSPIDYHDDFDYLANAARANWAVFTEYASTFSDTPVLTEQEIDFFAASPQSLFRTDPTILAPGTYQMFQKNYTVGYQDRWTVNYSMEFQVTDFSSPVPEPATVILFGFGLLGVARVSRRNPTVVAG